MSERDFVRRDSSALPPLEHQAPAIDAPDLTPSFINGAPNRLGTCHCEQLSDSQTRTSGAIEEESMVFPGHLGQRNRGKNTCGDDSGSALDVVIEGTAPILVLIEQPEGVRVRKILELQEHVLSEFGLGGGNELVNELVVLRASHSFLLEAGVHGVIEHRLVVGANIEHYGKCAGRVDSAQCGVQCHFAKRNAHPRSPQISQTQDAFSISENDGTDCS
mmetsp:Transcript_20937/g.23292  ORF Transcript_20937/g.23292 Transcript_20937/m.23292 type:complete len:218 (+) Transcript_20937:725-1378(+)